jgi:hypothetical protein
VVGGLLDRYPGAALAATNAEAFGEWSYAWEHKVPVGPPARVFWAAFESWIVPQCACAVRTALAREIGGFDEGAHGAEDYDFALRLAWRWPFVASERVTARYRRHPEQQSARPAVQYRALRRLRAAFTDRVAAEATPADAGRMRRFVIDDWWGLVKAAAAAEVPFADRSLLAGPGLRRLPWRDAADVQLRRALAYGAMSRPGRLTRSYAERARRSAAGVRHRLQGALYL